MAHLTNAEINHLHRLIGWVRCEIGQTPEEFVETIKWIGEKIDLSETDDKSKKRIVEKHQKAESVPKYVRAAIKSLSKALIKNPMTFDKLNLPEQPQLNAPLVRITK